ncbi:MAG: hypothetical protein WC769_01565 [Thermodesulfovibrionales bacterium]
MKNLMKHSWKLMMAILLALCLSASIACAPKAVVIPDSREIISLENGCDKKPGWYGISGGYLREIYRDCGIKESSGR